MLALIALHFVAAVVAPALVRVLDRRAFYVLGLVPAAAFVWAIAQSGTVSGPEPGTVQHTYSWVPELGLDLAFSLNTLTWLMTLLVTGIGALVLFYCAHYFKPGDTQIRRFSGVLTAFAGAMLGLVLADDLLLLYVFWESTTVLSYLLIGHNSARKANRRAAMNALLITAFGGLAMLIGIVIMGDAAGTYRISEILRDPPSGTAITVAILLILVGAISKSALVPFHFWLPGAMAAPTPVSAYLHAAAMVKAGVYLIALFAPTFAQTPGWRPVLLTLGLLTMIIGGVRALRQYDVKLLLAYGTVSQLGFLVTIVGAGTRSAALAGVAMITAHAFFKAALFLVVGIIDRTTGTRDLRLLSGMRQASPALFVTTLLAAASMAGLPPLTGFVAKEAVFAAFVDLDADTGIGPVAWLILAGLVFGSLLTMAYSTRLVWGIFGDKPGVADCVPRRRTALGFIAPPAILAAGGLALGILAGAQTERFAGYADTFVAGAHEPELVLWHGFSLPLVLSAISIVGGLLLFVGRKRVAGLQRKAALHIRLPDAERTYYAVMRGIDRLAVEVTGFVQRGSLPFYLNTILLVVVLLPGSALIANREWGAVYAWDNPAQPIVVLVMVGAAIVTVRSRRRLRAILLVGVTGYGTAMLFLLHGAPDLALTQVLVETVTLVVFVLVVRRLPAYFSDRPFNVTRYLRIGIGAATGAVASTLAYAAASSRSAAQVSEAYPAEAVSYGGGKNIVNVILVDIRAWDTMGELSVLVVAATGVASLIYLITGRNSRLSPSAAVRVNREVAEAASQSQTWLPGSQEVADDRRSIIFEVVTRLIFHTVIVFSIFLVFSGHNAPGGGFAGGLVAGIALMVRYLAGGRRELDEAAPVDAGLVLGLGLATATLSGLIPILLGGEVLQSAIVDISVGALGELHIVTSLFFDLGVYLVVVGLLLDILRSLGGGIDRDREKQAASAGEETS